VGKRFSGVLDAIGDALGTEYYLKLGMLWDRINATEKDTVALGEVHSSKHRSVCFLCITPHEIDNQNSKDA